MGSVWTRGVIALLVAVVCLPALGRNSPEAYELLAVTKDSSDEEVFRNHWRFVSEVMNEERDKDLREAKLQRLRQAFKSIQEDRLFDGRRLPPVAATPNQEQSDFLRAGWEMKAWVSAAQGSSELTVQILEDVAWLKLGLKSPKVQGYEASLSKYFAPDVSAWGPTFRNADSARLRNALASTIGLSKDLNHQLYISEAGRVETPQALFSLFEDRLRGFKNHPMTSAEWENWLKVYEFRFHRGKGLEKARAEFTSLLIYQLNKRIQHSSLPFSIHEGHLGFLALLPDRQELTHLSSLLESLNEYGEKRSDYLALVERQVMEVLVSNPSLLPEARKGSVYLRRMLASSSVCDWTQRQVAASAKASSRVPDLMGAP